MTAAAGEPPGAEYVAWAWRQPAAEGPVADFTEDKDSDQPGQSDLGVPVPLLVEPCPLSGTRTAATVIQPLMEPS